MQTCTIHKACLHTLLRNEVLQMPFVFWSGHILCKTSAKTLPYVRRNADDLSQMTVNNVPCAFSCVANTLSQASCQ